LNCSLEDNRCVGSWAPQKQIIDIKAQQDFDFETEREGAFDNWSTKMLVNEESTVLLYKLANFGGKFDLGTENTYVPLWFYVEPEAGMISPPEGFEEREFTDDENYLIRLIEFSK
jgi:hypothetical protein